MKCRIGILIAVISMVFTMPLHAEENNTLTVAYDPHLPPMHINEDDRVTGFSVELLNHVAKHTGYSVEYIPMTQEESLRAMANNEIDMILSIPFSDRNAEVVEFSDSILSTSSGLLVPKEADIHGISDLSSHTVALQRHSVEEEFLRNIRRLRYQATSNQETALRVFLQGRADAFAGNVLMAEYYVQNHALHDSYTFVEKHMLPLEYTIGVGKERYSLLNTVNEGLREVKSNGTYLELYEKWFGERESLIVDQLWNAVRIIGTLLVIAVILILIWVRWNRQLQIEVKRKTTDLNVLNQSLQEQIKQTKNSTEFQRQILNSSPRGIITIDEEKKITSINPRAKHILGMEGKYTGKFYTEHPFLKEVLHSKFSPVIEGDGTQYLGLETTWIRNGDQKLYLRYYVYPLNDFTGDVKGIIFGLEDNTEEQKMRMQIFEQEKSRALIRVVAGIAHEIRNPLSSIKTFVELLPKKFQNEKFREKMSTFLPQEIDRINQLIEGLMNYSRPPRQKREVVNVATIIQDCVVLFESAMEKKGFILSWSAPEHLYVKVDADQLKQVIINLMINGMDAMEEKNREGLTFTIRAWKTTKMVHIVLEDEGTGISDNAKQMLLEPFYTTKEKGTGLGLSIAHQYVTENKGQLIIDGEEGEGTRIELIFPFVETRKDVIND
ncbi:transporter substrate-binding domain-containing protein [Alteribacillus iranensis]|uniref:histidine kinase n=1 Tax=Alteribacillus iranensis TaxID=930128 RepID=A0A1I2B5A5_9BACI|nr:transporter substrate-binding domain-containing protein [Alteribacillus iranensis]SFE50473.1 amino acid-binding domain sensor histidine kinase [Alteribacillus iranensis]